MSQIPSFESLTGALAFSFVSYVLGEICVISGTYTLWGRASRYMLIGSERVDKVRLARSFSKDMSGFWTAKLVEAERKSELFCGLYALCFIVTLGFVIDAAINQNWFVIPIGLAVGFFLMSLFKEMASRAFSELIAAENEISKAEQVD